jgi:two-component system, cell cycle sensor histidine kinase and response regulator CckA
VPVIGLKAKITVVISALVVVIIALTALLSLRYFEKHYKETISSQQFNLVSVIADDFDSRIIDSHKLIIDAAATIDPAIFSESRRAKKFLDHEQTLLHIFNNGIFLFGPTGTMIAEAPMQTGRVGKDFSFREYFQITLSSQNPYISKPYFSTQRHKHPAIMFTAPVFDSSHKLVGVLAGSLDLFKSGFLTKIANTKVGSSGYLYVFNTDRTLIFHPDKSRILKRDVPPGSNKLFDRAIEGFEGSEETVNSRGVRSISSFRRLKACDWIIAANFPVAEAYAPFQQVKKYVLAGLVPIAAMTVLILVFLMKYLTRPLRIFEQHVEQLPYKCGADKILQIATGGEIGALVGSFNRMVTELDNQKQTVEASEALYRTLLDAIPGPVFYKDAQGVYLGCNKAFEMYIGRSRDEIVGRTAFDLFPEELAKTYHEADYDLFRRPGVQCYEARVLFAEGTLRDVMFYKATFTNIDGTLGGLVGTLLDITERNKAEDALRESEEKFRLFFEESRDAIFVADQECRLINVNQSAMEMFGYSRAEIIGLNLWGTFSDQSCKNSMMEEILAKGYIREVEVAFGRKDGTTVVCLLTASLRKSDSGEVIGFQGILHDISQRKQSENILIRQNEYLAALNETTKGLVSRLDPGSLLTAIINRAGALMKTGHSYIYLLEQTGDRMTRQSTTGVFNDFFDIQIRKGDGLVGQVWQSGLPLAIDDYHGWSGRLPDPAREVLRAMVGVPLKSREKVVGVIGLARVAEGEKFDEDEVDILTRFAELASLALDNARLYSEAQEELQERKRAEEQLRKLSHAIEQSPVSVIITDTAGAIEYVNPKFTETTGFTMAEVLGKNPRLLKSGETPEAEYHDLWQTIVAGNEWRGEFHNRKKTGEFYWELASISPMRNPEGVITHYIAVKEDITEQKKLETQLRHSQKMDAVGQLAGGIAHDFNNIITAIIGYASILDMKLDQESPFRASVKQILFSAKRAASLTQGLLAFSRKQITNPRPVNLNDIVRRVEKILERLIGEDIELATAMLVPDPIVLADGLQLEQVIVNLATNARDAMPKGGKLTIATDLVRLDEWFVRNHGLAKAGSYAKLTVTDTGTGMDRDTQKRIFDPFYTTKEVGKGTGLGLSIVYGIIKKHNGTIVCYSEPGMGSVFSIFLPVTAGEIPEAAPAAPPVIRGGAETVLLAEDDESVRRLTGDLLREYGYTVIEAQDGEEAIMKFREHRGRVQLLLLDLIMPKKNGKEVYDAIKKLKPGIKVIYTSGYESDMIHKRGKLPMDLNFLAKPVIPEDLLAIIRKVLDS